MIRIRFAIPRAITQALGLGSDASEETVLEEVKKLKDPLPADETPASIKKALGLKADASDDEVVAAIEKLRTDATATVEGVVQKTIAFGIESRRLLRCQRAWAEDYGRKDPRGLVSWLANAPAQGFATATDEFLALVRRRVDDSRTKLEFAAALERVVRGHPALVQEARTRLEFAASAAVADDDVAREIAREHPRLVEQARALVEASGRPMDYAAAMDAISAEHPGLVAEVADERETRMSESAKPSGSGGPATAMFMNAVEELKWADGVDWSEAARRVRERRPDLVERVEHERAGTARS